MHMCSPYEEIYANMMVINGFTKNIQLSALMILINGLIYSLLN